MFSFMGSCQSNQNQSKYTINYFTQKYGQQKMLEVARQNMKKQIMLQKLPQMSQSYKKKIHQSKILAIRQLNDKQTEIVNDIQNRIKKLQIDFSQGVVKAQEKYKLNAQDILGRKQIIQEFSKLRENTKQQYEKEEKNTQQKIRSDLQKHTAMLEQKKKIQFEQYGQLTTQDKQNLRKSMLKKYKKVQNQQKKQVIKQIGNGKSLDIKSNYDDLRPVKRIDQLERHAEKIIFQGQYKIKTINDDLNIKNIAQNLAQNLTQSATRHGCMFC